MTMTSGLLQRAGRYLLDAGRGLERAPVEVATAVVIAVAFSYAIETGGDAMRAWLELAVCGALVIAGAWTGTMLHALGGLTSAQRWTLTLGAAVLVGLYGTAVIDLERAAEAWRAVMLVAAAVLWLAAMPFFGKRLAGAVGAADRIGMMRAVTGRTVLRLIGAYLYCAALFAGLALAIGAVNTLFELRLDNEIYGHVAGWIFFALGPWIVAGGVQEYSAPVPPRSEVAGVVHRMTAFLVPPLLALYTLILYAYTVRIAVTGEVPNNIVSPMVFAAGVLALLALLLFDPAAGGSAGDRTLRAAPPLFVPMAALGVWTILLRTGQYGWTEFRLLRLVLIIALGALAIGASVQILRRQRLLLHVAPLALAAVLLLAAVGPWSVQSVSRADQRARLERALLDAGIEPGSPPVDTARVLPAEQFDRISGAATYLVQHFGPEALPPVFDRVASSGEHRWNVAGAIGLRRGEPPVDEARHVVARLETPGSWRVGDVVTHRIVAGPRRAGPAAADNATLEAETFVLTMSAAGTRYTADLSGVVAGLDPVSRAGLLAPDRAAIVARDTGGTAAGTLLLLELHLEIARRDSMVLHRLDGLLLLPDTVR
jgi:hypothetical protein